jgi:hypothetical protein
MQEYGSAAPTGGSGALGIIPLLILVVLYVYMAYSFMVIAKKTNTQNPWLAWIPIANVFLMLMIAKKPLWWFILLLIPFVNIVIAIILFMKIAEAVGKPSWVGILMIIPIVNIFIPGYLAFSDSPAPVAPVQMPPMGPATGV